MKLKKSKFLVLFLFVFSLFYINTNVFAEPTTLNENDFKIMGVAQQGENNIKLDWTELKNANYQLYQSVDGKEYETMSTFNHHNNNNKVRVLNIYPDSTTSSWPISGTISFKSALDNVTYTLPKSASLKMWMEQSNTEHPFGFGKGLIQVTPISMTNFNINPQSCLFDENNNYKYDVIMLGTWNGNSGVGFNANSIVYIENWIKAGKGFIAGHDTIRNETSTYGSSTNDYYMRTLRKYFGISLSVYDGGASGGSYGSAYSSNNPLETIEIKKKGLFTTYPWNIGEVGDKLIVPATHNAGENYYGNIWLSFAEEPEGTGNCFLSTYNNTAHIQTGDANCVASVDEQKILANLIFYCDQLTTETTFVDNSGQDFALPNKPNVKIDANNNKLLMEATDNGTTYQYKAKAYVDGQTIESQPIYVENTSGIKGYYYIINNNPNEKIMNATGNFCNGEIDLLSITSDTNYLHIAAVDNANNVSETTNLSMDDIIGINASNIAYTINTTDDTTNVDLNIVASGVNVNYQWEMKTENGEWEEIGGATLAAHSMDITNMNELLYYRCRVYNNFLSMYSNEVIVNPTTYDKTYVYVTQASTFSVKIPKVMILSGTTGKGEYVVSVNGNVSGLASVNVTPNDFAIMKDIANVKTSFNAIVTQNKTLFNANEIINGTTTNGLVDGSAYMTAGSWKGNFNFAIDFEDEKAKVNSIASINQNDDGTTVGYDKEQEQSTAYSHISFVN